VRAVGPLGLNTGRRVTPVETTPWHAGYADFPDLHERTKRSQTRPPEPNAENAEGMGGKLRQS
jgi:hypothetical protein